MSAAGSSMHWSKAMIIAIEVAEEVDNRPALTLSADEKRRNYEQACAEMMELYA